MRFVRLVMMVGLVGAILTGCSHSRSNTAADMTHVNLNDAITVWQKGTANPLVNYVPDDAPLVFVTQRGQHLHNSGLRTVLSGFFDEMFRFRELDSFDRYSKFANEWGLDQDGKIDAAMYVRDYYAVLHFTVADAHIAVKQLEDMIMDEHEDDNCYTKYKNGEFNRVCGPSVKVSDENDWRVFQFYNDDKVVPVKLGIHHGDKVISMVYFDSEHPLPENVLGGTRTPFTPKLVEKDAVTISRIDYGRLAEFLIKLPFVKDNIDEEYWEDDGYQYGEVDKHRKDELCDTERITGCEGIWTRRNMCETESALHCTSSENNKSKQDDLDCEDDGCMSSLMSDESDDSDDSGSANSGCSWRSGCLDCVENQSCYAALFNLKQMSPQERLKRVGKTSIGDEVCVNEIKSMFQDFPVTELVAVVRDTGAPGVKLVTNVSSDAVIRNMKSIMTDHAEIKDDDVLARGFVGFNLGKALSGIVKYLEMTFEYNSYECSQLQYISHEGADLRKEIRREMYLEFGTYFKHMEAISLVLKRLEVDRWGDPEFPQVWGYLRNSSVGLEKIKSELSGDDDSMSESEDANNFKFKKDGNALVIATSPYDPQTTEYSMVKDENTFIDVQIKKELVDLLAGKYTSWLVSDYRLNVGITNGEFVVSVMPQSE